MENSFPKYICIGADAYRAHPNQDMEVLLVGKKSSLGFSIIHVRGKK